MSRALPSTLPAVLLTSLYALALVVALLLPGAGLLAGGLVGAAVVQRLLSRHRVHQLALRRRPALEPAAALPAG
ncbi:hypothetical protein GB931_13110 [Modestobacter sp. I12A-02628]|uniref:Uncharacterized protein n=1 Tax=Goekera deserti TaxID=2497753 RepID=A0A7K3W9Y4_9ACTN|nr:hypothetical protein [Goekera deserti]MPQ98841.1 hypothetical protein [Goekera deserti]NDI49660.1 hypothetical protein [Goekera deserti]NEL53147.1 hypothetical protein [Goekera deserti]